MSASERRLSFDVLEIKLETPDFDALGTCRQTVSKLVLMELLEEDERHG